MPRTPSDHSRRTRRPGGRLRRTAVLAVVGPALASVLGLLVATGPAQAAAVPPVLASTAQTSAAQTSTAQTPTAQTSAVTPLPTGAVTPSPSPTPGQRPSGPTTAPAQGVGPRDETGTGVVLPLLAATAVGLVVLGLLFASAVTRRQREERRL